MLDVARPEARLVIQDLDKAYAAPVLKKVDLSVAPGEIHALVGENGAGKTTLLNILTGMTDCDGGRMLLDGERYAPRRPADALAAGVSLAAQELSIVNTLSVAENVGLRQLPARRGIIDRDRLERMAMEALALVGLDNVPPDRTAGELSLADRQLLEIARALAATPSLLLLDEPTAALNADQADRLHDILRERAAAGASIVYVSHRLHDVLEIAGRVSVLRDGRVVASDASSAYSVDDLVSLMAGRALAELPPRNASKAPGRALITAEQLTTQALNQPVSLRAHAGEIVGLAGLAGAGRSELLHALFGLDEVTGGTVTRRGDEGEVTIDSPATAIRAGVALVGEDRQSMGLFAGLPVMTNMMIPGGRAQRSPFATIDEGVERTASGALVRDLGIACRDPDQDIAELSGGNQQKALIGRWLNAGADVFLLDEPTRGVDVATKLALYQRFRELAASGSALIVASSEIEELLALCDRIVVLSDRRIAAEFEHDEFDEEAILTAAFSAFSQPSVAAR